MELTANIADAVYIHSLYLTKDGVSQVGENKGDANTLISTTTQIYGEGQYGDMWSTTLTPAEVNAETFGIMVKFANGTSQEGVEITVGAVTMFAHAEQ